MKLGDLGIAQSHLHAHIPARHSGRRMGKLGYLAPEQVTGAALDVRTDLFAVGVIAAELLMGGKPLFRGGSELAILLAIRDGNIDQFASTAKSLPEPLRAFVVHLLAAAPDARPHSAMEALAVLDAVIAGAHVAETDAPARKQFGDLVAHATGEFLKVTGEYPLPLPDHEKTPHFDVAAGEVPRGEGRFFPTRDPLADDQRETLIPGSNAWPAGAATPLTSRATTRSVWPTRGASA
ncbi:MAG: hypothetical protein IPG81_16000 [Sandaracinaceae bacterium]|nr:hypothetical protein [Sandaracinaceae bacterium]